MKSFRDLAKGTLAMMDKSTEATLNTFKQIKTNKVTSGAWYKEDTFYAILSVDNGKYSKRPGVKTAKGFIKLKDINMEF